MLPLYVNIIELWLLAYNIAIIFYYDAQCIEPFMYIQYMRALRGVTANI